MPKFKEALERGKKARRQEDDSNVEAERPAMPDFIEQAKSWLNDVAIASLEAAKADVAAEVTVDIDTAPRRHVKTSTPSIRFQIYREGDSEKAARNFTVKVEVSGAVLVYSPGIVAKDVGTIGDRSDLRFRTLIAELIEEAAKGI